MGCRGCCRASPGLPNSGSSSPTSSGSTTLAGMPVAEAIPVGYVGGTID